MIQRLKAFATVLKESKHPFRMIAGQILVKTGFNRFFTISMDGYKIKFSPSALAITLFSNSGDRHEDDNFLHKILKPGQVYVDIGANIGTLVLTAATVVGPAGKVIGIEAHPGTFQYLKANVGLNDFSNIVLINSAAGEVKGSIFFSNINSDDQNKVLLQQEKGIEVKVDTADNLLSGESYIDLLKIDVEGYEKFVFQGASATLQKTAVVYFESWEKHFSGFNYSTTDVIIILQQSGFEVYKPIENTLHVLPNTYRSAGCENLVAVKDPAQFCKRYGYRIVS